MRFESIYSAQAIYALAYAHSLMAVLMKRSAFPLELDAFE
jgi:hypothetical protein